MNDIEKMIVDLCPTGVRFDKLGNVADVYTGTQFNKSDMQEVGDYPVINGGVSASGYSEKYNEPENTITISQGGASAGYVNWITTKFWVGAHCYIVRPNTKELDNRYLYFFVKQQESALMESKHGAGIPGLNREKVKSLSVPIPPIAVQKEIVKILDKFTSLEAELEAELEARRKQYNHYRDVLLAFGHPDSATNPQKRREREFNVIWQRLNQVCKIMNGKDYKSFAAGDIPVYGTGGIMTKIDTSVSDKPSVLIPRKGSIGNLFYVDKPFWTVDTIYWTNIDDTKILPKYLYHYLSTQDLEKLNTAVGGIPSLTQAVLNKLDIPIPPMDKQERIVAILDKFDALVNDLSAGLPAEIAARRQQYEYYRDKLLTFTCLPAGTAEAA